MTNEQFRRYAPVTLLGALLLMLAVSCKSEPPASTQLPMGHPAAPIGGWVDFCARNPMDPLCPHP